MKLRLVRSDNLGLYVRAGGYVARPGDVIGYCHAHDQSDGNLKEGDRVKARHIACSPMVQITLADGKKLIWCTEDIWIRNRVTTNTPSITALFWSPHIEPIDIKVVGDLGECWRIELRDVRGQEIVAKSRFLSEKLEMWHCYRVQWTSKSNDTLRILRKLGKGIENEKALPSEA